MSRRKCSRSAPRGISRLVRRHSWRMRRYSFFATGRRGSRWPARYAPTWAARSGTFQNDERFHCPCHGSVFAADGSVVHGPAPRPLEWFEVTETRDGQLTGGQRQRGARDLPADGVTMNLIREIWQSIVRRDPLSTDKGKSELVFLNVWLHIHPAKVKKENMKLKHTLYLGFITFFLFLILVTTGIALMFYYRPYPPQAYQDMKDLQFVVFLGRFLRNMHRWAAHGMVICVFLHMCRVFYTGSYKRPRQFNWVIGVVLLLLTLGLSFTGYLLPWDQLAFWAITVGNEHRQLRAAGRRAGPRAAAGRPHGRRSRAAAILCAARSRAALAGDAADDGALLAGAKRRRPFAAGVEAQEAGRPDSW